MGDVGSVVFGWLLGLISAVGLDCYRQHSRRKSLKTLLRTETRSLRFRLVLYAASMVARFGKHDHDFIAWAAQHLSNLCDTEEQTKTAKVYSLMLSSKQAVDVYHALLQEEATGAVSVPAVITPAHDALMQSLDLFGPDVQLNVLESLGEIALLNYAVEEARYYLRLTFESDIDPEVLANVQKNLRGTYLELALRARRAADALRRVEDTLG